MRVLLTTTTTATLTEEWDLDVPEGTDMSDPAAVLALLDGGEAEIQEVTNVSTDDERDREAVSIRTS